ncbi:MAG: penicillin acylase family protein [Saprospiraceae bacterium]|nr:penicillin acylase family protein [Saprospiraceae bacterium]
MKPSITLFLWTLILAAWIFLSANPISMGDQTLPPIGPFFSLYDGFWQNAESEKDFKNMELNHPSLNGVVEVVLDDRMVPHIFAENDNDAAFAQGYMHAKLRLFQLDIASRAISGRLSEILGPRTLDHDKQIRREGIVWGAEKTLELYQKDPESMQLIQAYTDGINHYIQNLCKRQLPLEFKLLGYQPEEWTLLKCVLTSKSMARTLTTKNYDIQNSNLKAEIGDSLFQFLFPHAQPGQSPVHPGPWTGLKNNVLTSTQETPVYGYNDPFAAQDPQQAFASNNWAVSGKKSATGNPILCNDPHLQLTFPSIWIENHLVTPEKNVYGVSLLGVPHIIIGFNEHIAWGITNGGQDVVDWLEIKWNGQDKKKYNFDDQTLNTEYRIETIKIKGQKSLIDTVSYTRWVPVAIKSEESGKGDLVFKWSGHDAKSERELLTFLLLNKAKNIGDYMEAISVFPSPIQNVVFASREGDIALKSQGFWPLRSDMSGQFISDGAQASSSWTHYLDNSQLPATINPERQFVSSANQHSTDDSYPFVYMGSFEEFRGRTLNKKLEEKSKLSLQDMADIQNSNYSLKAEEALPSMLLIMDKEDLSSAQKSALEILKSWNYEYTAASPAPAIFNEWFNAMEKLTFDETTHEKSSHSRLPDQWKLVELINDIPDHNVFDIYETVELKESAKDIAKAAFVAACDTLNLENKSIDSITWLTHQKSAVNHLLRIPALSRLLDVGGSSDALNAMTSTHGPSWRMIIELTPTGPKALGVYPGGQSGNPGSKYYDDSIDTWSKGKHHELHLFTNAAEVSNALFTIKMNKL